MACCGCGSVSAIDEQSRKPGRPSTSSSPRSASERTSISKEMADSDLYKADKRTICVQKVLFRMWHNRDDINQVTELARMLINFVDEQRVFTDIEFFLPQLLNLVVHLDMNSRAEDLEMLVMVICQNSMHAALQISFMLAAYLEDYQPENNDGKHNPNCNPFFFKRASRLLQNAERAVIYGSSVLSRAEEEALKRLSERTEEMTPGAEKLKDMKKEMIADAIARQAPGVGNAYESDFESVFDGKLMFKRNKKKSTFHSKSWKSRHFVIDQRVLLCYRDPHSVNPLRSISLLNCEIEEYCHPKYGDTCFNLINYSSDIRFQLRAPNKEARNRYIHFIKKVSNGAPQVKIDNEETEANTPSAAADDVPKGRIHIIEESEMTGIERKRFNYFKQLRIFITNLTNICERLRFKERSVRKYFLRRDMHDLLIPPFCYLPLTSSTQPFAQILRALPNEGHAFQTKARCPALMLFETERHPTNSDVATFLECELEKFDDNDVIDHDIIVKYATSGVFDDPEADDAAEQEHDQSIRHRGSILGRNSVTDASTSDSSSDQHRIWKGEGEGMRRLRTLTAGGSDTSPRDDVDSKEDCLIEGATETPAITAGSVDPSEVHISLMEMENPIFGESFEQKATRLQQKSPYGRLPGWHLSGLIAKSNDDVRQEVFVMQLISYYKDAFTEANIPSWLFTYRILSASQTTGLIELIPDSISIDGLKKKDKFPGSLRKYYEEAYGYKAGEAEPPAFRQAIMNYITSMASYSIVCYLLAIKDRHNGNIMINREGYVIHIDFGFVFGLAPGKAASMEKAEWKLTPEMVEVMGGPQSHYFEQFKQMCIDCLLVARKHAKQVKTLLEMTMYQSSFPSFRYNKYAVRDFEKRLFLDMPDQTIPKQVNKMMKHSYRHTGTYLYDQFQLATNGIAP